MISGRLGIAFLGRLFQGACSSAGVAGAVFVQAGVSFKFLRAVRRYPWRREL